MIRICDKYAYLVRTLIQLLRRNHRMVLFVLLEIIALSWITSTHAHPKGKIASIRIIMNSELVKSKYINIH